MKFKDDTPTAAAPAPQNDAEYARFEESLDFCFEAVLIIGRDWRIRYANRQACCEAGRLANQLEGLQLAAAWPQLFEQIEATAARLLNGGDAIDLQVEIAGAPARVRIAPVREGLALYLAPAPGPRIPVGEGDLAAFIAGAAVPIHSVASDGTILWANDAELRLLGYSAEEYIGRNLADFHVDQPVLEQIIERLKAGEELHNFEARLRCKDGSIRYVAITSNGYFRRGEFMHTRCFTRDIGSERLTQEVHHRLSAIVESSDDAIISKDLNGIIRSWNRGAERIFGYTAEEAIGQPVAMLAVPERRDEVPNIIARISRGERVDHFRTKRMTKDGRVLSISLTVSPVRDYSGRIVGASKIARDVTEEERNQEALRTANDLLERTNEDLEQFAYSASHDLQEPLRMVAAYSEMIQRKFKGKLGPEGEEYLGYILQGATRMDQLLADLRAFTRASTGESDCDELADSEAALKASVENLTAAIEESDAVITSDPLPRVRIPHLHIEQVFQNLVGNAIRYRSEEAPRIHVSAVRTEDAWQFSVRDNGMGIDPQYKEQIFGIFKRLHSNAKYPGTGMGLAICKRVVDRTGGRIWVESEPGRGSTFYFTVPAR